MARNIFEDFRANLIDGDASSDSDSDFNPDDFEDDVESDGDESDAVIHDESFESDIGENETEEEAAPTTSTSTNKGGKKKRDPWVSIVMGPSGSQHLLELQDRQELGMLLGVPLVK